MKQNLLTFFAALCLIVLLTDCKSRRNNQNEISESDVVYPVDVIQDTLVADVRSQTTLYPLQEEVLESFLEKALNFQGKKWTAKADFPD
jgi:hypothetical protein